MTRLEQLQRWAQSLPDNPSIFAPFPTPIPKPKGKATHKRSNSVRELPTMSDKRQGKRRTSFAGRDHDDGDICFTPFPASTNGPRDPIDTTESYNGPRLVTEWKPLAHRCFDDKRISWPDCLGGINYLQPASKRQDKRRVSFASKPEVIERPPSISSSAASSVSSIHRVEGSYWDGKRDLSAFNTTNSFERGPSVVTSDTESPVLSDSISDDFKFVSENRTAFYSTPNVLLSESYIRNNGVSSVSSVSSNDSWQTAINDCETQEEDREWKQRAIMSLQPYQIAHGDIEDVEQEEVNTAEQRSQKPLLPLPPLPTESTSISGSEYSYDDAAPISNYTQLLRDSGDIIEYHASALNLYQRVEHHVNDTKYHEPVRKYKTLDEIVDSLHYPDHNSDKISSKPSSLACSVDHAETRAQIWPRIGLRDVEDAVAVWSNRRRRPDTAQLPSAQELRAARRLAPTDADSIRSYGKGSRIKKGFLGFRLKTWSSKSSRDDSVIDLQKPTLPDVAENWPLS